MYIGRILPSRARITIGSVAFGSVHKFGDDGDGEEEDEDEDCDDDDCDDAIAVKT